MTLPGINRRIAQTIVDHRNAIGGRFQRIDDLALVSGIGADKLSQIRPEISIRTVRAFNGLVYIYNDCKSNKNHNT